MASDLRTAASWEAGLQSRLWIKPAVMQLSLVRRSSQRLNASWEKQVGRDRK